MRAVSRLRAVALLAVLTCAAWVTLRAEAQVTVTSPDGAVTAAVGVETGRLVVAVERNGRRVLEPSPVGLIADGANLGERVRVGRPVTYAVDTSYRWNGHAAELHDRANGVRIPIHHPRTNWILDVRAYDDGAAWRYVVGSRGRHAVTGEATAFHLPDGAAYWSHGNTKSYEAMYERYDAARPGVTGSLTMPLTVELPGGGYACLAESDVMHYSGMTLAPGDGGGLRAVFEDDPQGWTLDGPFASPWRVCIAVDDLDGLVNSSIIYNLAPPPDPRLFPQGAKTSWIRPGRAFWQWWFYSWDGMNWDRQAGFVDQAAALNCQYYLVDDGWESESRGWMDGGRTKWDSLAHLAEYGSSKGVELWVWRDWKRLRDKDDRTRFFRRLAAIGVVGVKVDFMESESQERLAFYRDVLEDAARHRIMVNFHGSNKSAGEMRTWPNELTRESVFGLEQNKGGPRITLQHYTAVPFTAFVSGPKDFTPTTFRRGNAGTTFAFQLATAVIYTSPFLCWANRAEEFLDSPALELIRRVPTVWDQTRVLPGSEIGKFAAFAREKDGEWWIGIASGSKEPRTYTLDLDFLGDGRWRVEAVEDVPGGSPALRRTITEVSAGETVSIQLESAGGYTARLTLLDPG